LNDINVINNNYFKLYFPKLLSVIKEHNPDCSQHQTGYYAT